LAIPRWGGDIEPYGEPLKAWYFGRIVVTMAGVLAVERLTGNPTGPLDPNTVQWVPGSDWSGLGFMAGQLGSDDLQRAHDEAKQVLRENWRAVEVVARALLEQESLDKGALYAVLDEASCNRDEEAVALVEEAYREGEHERLLNRRWELRNRLEAYRDQDTTEAEVTKVWREFVLVDKELVEEWGSDSWVPKRDEENDA